MAKTKLRIIAAALAAVFVCSCATQRYGQSPDDVVYEHTMKSGETLRDVAADYYGKPRRADDLAEFNRDVSPRQGAVVKVPMSPRDLEWLQNRERARKSYVAGVALVEKGAYLDATKRFQESLEIDRGFTAARYNLAVALQKMKSHERARDEFAAAVRQRPDKTGYRFGYGNSLFYLKDYRRASSEFERVLESKPRHAKALYSLAVCYEKMRRVDKARGAWSRYVELDGDSAWGQEARRRLAALERR